MNEILILCTNPSDQNIELQQNHKRHDHQGF